MELPKSTEQKRSRLTHLIETLLKEKEENLEKQIIYLDKLFALEKDSTIIDENCVNNSTIRPRHVSFNYGHPHDKYQFKIPLKDLHTYGLKSETLDGNSYAGGVRAIPKGPLDMYENGLLRKKYDLSSSNKSNVDLKPEYSSYRCKIPYQGELELHNSLSRQNNFSSNVSDGIHVDNKLEYNSFQLELSQEKLSTASTNDDDCSSIKSKELRFERKNVNISDSTTVKTDEHIQSTTIWQNILTSEKARELYYGRENITINDSTTTSKCAEIRQTEHFLTNVHTDSTNYLNQLGSGHPFLFSKTCSLSPLQVNQQPHNVAIPAKQASIDTHYNYTESSFHSNNQLFQTDAKFYGMNISLHNMKNDYSHFPKTEEVNKLVCILQEYPKIRIMIWNILKFFSYDSLEISKTFFTVQHIDSHLLKFLSNREINLGDKFNLEAQAGVYFSGLFFHYFIESIDHIEGEVQRKTKTESEYILQMADRNPYVVRRLRNNLSAKKSRDKKRKEEFLLKLVNKYLTVVNTTLSSI